MHSEFARDQAAFALSRDIATTIERHQLGAASALIALMMVATTVSGIAGFQEKHAADVMSICFAERRRKLGERGMAQ